MAISSVAQHLAGAQAFLTVRSYLSTARKHEMNPLAVLRQLFQANPWLPAPVGARTSYGRHVVTAMVLFLIDTGGNDVSVYPSPASLTGDLEVYEVEERGLEVYDAQARYLPLAWQAPTLVAAGLVRRAWVHHNTGGRAGSTMRCDGSCRSSVGPTWPMPRPWTSKQPPRRSAITTAGRCPAPDGPGEKTARTPDSRTLNSYRASNLTTQTRQHSTRSADATRDLLANPLARRVESGLGEGVRAGGRDRYRTCDLCRVKAALSR
jgi:hypothetical protein